jgi:hypothetical protein
MRGSDYPGFFAGPLRISDALETEKLSHDCESAKTGAVKFIFRFLIQLD